MDGGAAGEVESAEDEGPAVGVPGPAGDGVVDDCGPDEDEDGDGTQAGVFGEGADCEDRKSTRLNSSHSGESRMPSSA